MSKALHPQAKFDPIPPDLDLQALIDSTPNFKRVVTLPLSQIQRLGPAGFEKLVRLHVIEGGRPLVIEGWDKVLPRDLFSAEWLEKTYDKKQENVRDITAQSDIPMTTGHYLRSMRQLTNQWSPTNFRDERRQRLYLKDIDCPPEWYEQLKKIIPPNVFYMNDNVSVTPTKRADDIFGAPETTAAVAGDLMSSLPEEMRAQNLMCYIGHEGTYTPAHREMCASLGQNIMVDASEDGNGKGEKAGSSIWFMTETKDREVIREYFLSMLGHDIEIEKHFAQINAWKKANFPVYVVEQKVGDFILVPPLAPHQVWNRGTRTMKVAWNRTTVETLDMALHEALPRARLVCRDEQYKNKAIIYYTLEKYYKELQGAEESSDVGWLALGQDLVPKQMAHDFRRLFNLYTSILVDEMFGLKQSDVEFIEFDSNITCSYCRANIFNRFLTCKCCVRQLLNGDEDTYDICMECYAMGRSCVCVSGLQWCEQWRWADLVEKHETWRSMVIKQDGFIDMEQSPQPLELARKKSGKKSVAQICQEQLRRRPWNDITKPPEAAPDVPPEESEPEVDENGYLKKKKKPARKPKKGDVYRCHVCCHKDYTYKLSFCTTCAEAYCFGVLWRAFDTLPQTVMEIENWQCPRCLGICNCGTCRRIGNTTPYVPKNTLLGHDTRPVADDRSIESIVDFRMHNLGWLKAAGEENRSKESRRMLRLREEADAAKASDPTTAFVDDAHEVANGVAPAAGAPVADMEGASDYPEPPMGMGGERMMGMGFYEQDNSVDKILFDAFQMPTLDHERESDISDFIKKTLRLAKRKARLETDDDPDFQGPRTQPRKKPKTDIDQLVNLDPALFGSLANPNPTGSPSAPATATQPVADGAPQENQAQQEERTRSSLPIDPLRPTLRKAKPMASYVEAEEPLEDPDDTVPVKVTPKDGGGDGTSKNPVDLAMDAVRAMTSMPQNAAVSTPVTTGKRRGRPPRSSLGPSATPSTSENKAPKEAPASEAPGPSAPTSEAEGSTGRRRGRPPGRRSTLQTVEPAPSPSSLPPKRRGRPPATSTRSQEQPRETPEAEAEAPIPPASVKYMSMAERLALRGKKKSFKIKGRQSTDATGTPGSRTSSARSLAATPTTAAATPTTAAAGRSRTSTATPSARSRNADTTEAVDPAANPISAPPQHGRPELHDEDFAPDAAAADDDESESEATPPPPSPPRRGPTVVRLDLSDSDSGSESASRTASFTDDDDSGSDGAPKRHFVAVSGRGRGRGRGARGRGGVRGRG